MIIDGMLITDVFGNELNIGDKVIIMTKYNYLIKGQICKIDRSVQYYKWSKLSNTYDANDKGWSVLFVNGKMCNMYKI